MLEVFQQAGGELEQPGAAVLVVGFAVGLAQFRQQPGEFALLTDGCERQLVAELTVQRPQYRGHRRERQPVRADLDAAAHGTNDG
jgi:hypothetical protein